MRARFTSDETPSNTNRYRRISAENDSRRDRLDGFYFEDELEGEPGEELGERLGEELGDGPEGGSEGEADPDRDADSVWMEARKATSAETFPRVTSSRVPGSETSTLITSPQTGISGAR